MTVRDDDSELISGSYPYFIDYVKCAVVASDFGYGQDRYNFTDDETKIDIALDLIEID